MSGEALAAAAGGGGGGGSWVERGGRGKKEGVSGALIAIGRPAPLPRGYGLRCLGDMDAQRIAASAGLQAADGSTAPGDILLVRCSPVQLHVLVAAGLERFVHAHAGLRRVVLGPRDPAWHMIGRWRLPETL
jgi:hypothetical protein